MIFSKEALEERLDLLKKRLSHDCPPIERLLWEDAYTACMREYAKLPDNDEIHYHYVWFRNYRAQRRK